MKKNIILLILFCFILILIGCTNEKHNHVLININDNIYADFYIDENSKYIFYSNSYKNQIIRVDKTNKEEFLIKDIRYYKFSISEDYLYYIYTNKIVKCDLIGNVISERTFDQDILDHEYENGFIYLLFNGEEDSKNYKLVYLSELDFTEDFNYVYTPVDTNIEINGSYFYVSGNLINVFHDNIAYIRGNCSYLYNGIINYDIKKLDFSSLGDRRYYKNLYKIIDDELYISIYSYVHEGNGSSKPDYNCFWQIKETYLYKYNFTTEETKLIYKSHKNEPIINFFKDEVIIYKDGKIVGVNLESLEESIYGEIEKIKYIKGEPSRDECDFFVGNSYVYSIYNGSKLIII